jgi:hypothetical protein
MAWENKAESKGTWKSDYTMGALDFERYEGHLMEADAYVKLIINKEPWALQPFFGVLKVLWINFKPIIRLQKREKYKEKIDLIEKLFKDWNQTNRNKGRMLFPLQLANELVEFYAMLLECKQYIGLGIKVSRDESEFTKIKRSAGLIN